MKAISVLREGAEHEPVLDDEFLTRNSEDVPAARALGLGRCGTQGGQFRAERRIAAHGLEPRVAVLVGEAAVPFGDEPVPPPRLCVARRVQSPARAARQAD
jgi:hypothetical protein